MSFIDTLILVKEIYKKKISFFNEFVELFKDYSGGQGLKLETLQEMDLPGYPPRSDLPGWEVGFTQIEIRV